MEQGRKKKSVSQSRAEQSHILTMKNLNGNQLLFGAQMFSWMDEVAVIVARRHSGYDVTTARVDECQFLATAINCDTIIVKGELVSVGRTSMRVKIEIYKERFDAERILIANAYFLMVALDADGHPVTVPELE
jgi:acyl-CoA hydrolase